jgi:hypothetical protein
LITLTEILPPLARHGNPPDLGVEEAERTPKRGQSVLTNEQLENRLAEFDYFHWRKISQSNLADEVRTHRDDFGHNEVLCSGRIVSTRTATIAGLSQV